MLKVTTTGEPVSFSKSNRRRPPPVTRRTLRRKLSPWRLRKFEATQIADRAKKLRFLRVQMGRKRRAGLMPKFPLRLPLLHRQGETISLVNAPSIEGKWLSRSPDRRGSKL